MEVGRSRREERSYWRISTLSVEAGDCNRSSILYSPIFRMHFTSPISLFIAVLIAIAIFIVGWTRRPALPRLSIVLASAGIIALTLATGGISCRSGGTPRVAVMVDLS